MGEGKCTDDYLKDLVVSLLGKKRIKGMKQGIYTLNGLMGYSGVDINYQVRQMSPETIGKICAGDLDREVIEAISNGGFYRRTHMAEISDPILFRSGREAMDLIATRVLVCVLYDMLKYN